LRVFIHHNEFLPLFILSVYNNVRIIRKGYKIVEGERVGVEIFSKDTASFPMNPAGTAVAQGIDENKMKHVERDRRLDQRVNCCLRLFNLE
jgi:hypothetical protein